MRGFEGHYEVSNRGRVRSLDKWLRQKNGWGWFKRFYRGRLRVLSVDADGYLRVGLYARKIAKSVLVHRLVAQAFIPNPYRHPEVDHRNSNRIDARAKNLQWVAEGENTRLRVERGRGTKGETQHLAKLNTHSVKTIRRMAARGKSFADLATEHGVVAATISAVVSRLTWKHVP